MLAACRRSCDRYGLPVPAFGIFGVGVAALVSCAAVGVCDIQPKGAVVFEYPAQLPEHFNKPVNVLLRRVLPPNLHIKPIVPQSIVGRACDAAVYAFARKFPQGIEGVAVDDYVGVHVWLTSSGFVVITL